MEIILEVNQFLSLDFMYCPGDKTLDWLLFSLNRLLLYHKIWRMTFEESKLLGLKQSSDLNTIN